MKLLTRGVAAHFRADNPLAAPLGTVYGGLMRAVRLYLRLGDRVFHDCREEWGGGSVVEEMTSTVEGGTCLVRILFEDGEQRTFNNDLDSEMCCYFMGLRREHKFDWDLGNGRGRRPVRRRFLPSD